MKVLSLSCIIVLTGLYANSQNQKNIDPSKGKICFTENKGQVSDQNNNPRPDVLFGGSNGMMNFHLKKSGISYQMCNIESWKEEESSKGKSNKVADKISTYRVDINWLNSNRNYSITTDNQIGGYSNYYLQSCPNGALNVRSYQGITYKNIYNKVDLHYYEKKGDLKYDYIVGINGGYKQIKLEVKGADIEALSDGSIQLKTPFGIINEGKPIAYQNGRELKAKWLISNNVLSFNIDDYDPAFELIIDPPTRVWASYYGGILLDNVSYISLSGTDLYYSGWVNTNTGTIIATVGTYQSVQAGGTDMFLAKFDTNGIRQWGTYFGGSGNELTDQNIVDAAGNIYLAGYTNSNSGIASAGAHQTTFGGGIRDGCLAKFDNSGMLLWSTYYGGNSYDDAEACTVDASLNVYLVGNTSSSVSPLVIATPGSQQPNFGGGPTRDGYLVKFNSSGVRQWGTYYGGTNHEVARGCATDMNGMIYLLGSTAEPTASIIATPGTHQPTWGGGADLFLVQFNNAGVRQWGTYYGGTATDDGFSMTTDAAGNLYVLGRTNTPTSTIIATPGSHQPAYSGGNYDDLLIKFNNAGVRQWATYYGGANEEYPGTCAVDPWGNIYITGYTGTTSGTAVATTGSYQDTFGGGTYDAYLVQFNNAGVRQWGTYYGGLGNDYNGGCALNPTAKIYIGGGTNSNNSISSVGSWQDVYGGNVDGYMVKFVDCSLTQVTCFASPVFVCEGGSSVLSGEGIADTFTWSTSSNSTSIVVTPTATSVYTLSGSIEGCTNIATSTVMVVVVPIPTISVNGGSVCAGQSFTINPTGAATYTISGGNAVVSPSASISYSITGSTSGCIASNTAVCNVTVFPQTMITVGSSSNTMCMGDSVILTANGATSYTWNNSINSNSTVVSPTASTSYTVYGANINSCADSATISINVLAIPTLTLYSSADTLCLGKSVTLKVYGAPTFSWSNGATGYIINVFPNVSTIFSVTGYSLNGCKGVQSHTVTVVSCAGIKTNSFEKGGIRVYPNPTSGEFIIESYFGNLKILVFNSLGEKIRDTFSNGNSSIINLNKYSNGIYVLRLIEEDGNYSDIKVVKSN